MNKLYCTPRIIVSIIAVLLLSCQKGRENQIVEKSQPAKDTNVVCDDSCKTSTSTGLSCKLTTSELQQRKATIIERLKKQLLEKKELKQGYAFRFSGSDTMVDELSYFIKTERECCDFFTFTVSIYGDKSTAWLELTGPPGVKEFITDELGL